MAPMERDTIRSAPVGRLQIGSDRGSKGAAVGGSQEQGASKVGIKVWGFERPPLPGKVALDTTLNLSNISVGNRSLGPQANGGGLPSALRQAGATSRTVRGTQRTVRLQHDFDVLESFFKREREFAKQRNLACGYPWSEECAHERVARGAGGVHSSSTPIVVEVREEYHAWEEEMQTQLGVRLRGLVENQHQQLVRSREINASSGSEWSGMGGSLGGRRASDNVHATRKGMAGLVSQRFPIPF